MKSTLMTQLYLLLAIILGLCSLHLSAAESAEGEIKEVRAEMVGQFRKIDVKDEQGRISHHYQFVEEGSEKIFYVINPFHEKAQIHLNRRLRLTCNVAPNAERTVMLVTWILDLTELPKAP